jgi:hypothetical protein
MDKTCSDIEHSHSSDHVDISDSHAEPSMAPRQGCR